MELDKQLYEKFLSGDIGAFEELVIKHKDNLIFFISRYVKDVHISEDIAQDVFAYVYVYKDKYNFKYAFKTYLFMLAKRRAVDYIRKNHNTVPLYEEDLITDERELDRRIIALEEKKLVRQAMDTLKADYQAAIFLVDFEEMTYSDAAASMGKTAVQFKVLLHRARHALEKKLVMGGYVHED